MPIYSMFSDAGRYLPISAKIPFIRRIVLTPKKRYPKTMGCAAIIGTTRTIPDKAASTANR
ncbi:hypothetical protein P4K96_28980, partial [Bacillus cereus]|nr:hypothetical protein [Bacillus cereus]